MLPKLKYFLILFLGLTLVLAKTAEAANISVTTNNVNQGETAFVDVFGLPNSNQNYSLTINGQTISFTTRSNGTCTTLSNVGPWRIGRDGSGQNSWCTYLQALEQYVYHFSILTGQLPTSTNQFPITSTNGITPNPVILTLNTPAPVIDESTLPDEIDMGGTSRVVINNCTPSGYLLCSINQADHVRCSTKPTSEFPNGCGRINGTTIACNVDFNTPGAWVLKANCQAGENPTQLVNVSALSKTVTVNTSLTTTLTLDKSSVNQGGFLTARVRELSHALDPEPHNYRLSISSYNNSREWDYMTFPVLDHNTCGPIVENSGVFRDFFQYLESHEQYSFICAFDVRIQLPSTYNCNPGTNEKRCKVALTDTTPEPDTVVATTEFSVEPTTTPTGLTVSVSSPVYEDQEEILTAKGCDSGESVKFYWWTAAGIDQDVLDCLSQNSDSCEGMGGGDDEVEDSTPNPATADGNGTASVTKKFNNIGGYYLQAACQTSGRVGYIPLEVVATGKGSETLTAKAQSGSSPEGTVPVGESFDIFVGGIGSGCYYVRVQDPDGNFSSQINPISEPTGDCEDLGDLDDRPLLTNSDSWDGDNGGASVGTVNAEINGLYVVYLEKLQKDSNWRSALGDAAYIGSAALGGVAGFFAGTPLPGPGNAIGTVVGAGAGAWVGNHIRNAISNSKDEIRATAAICSGTDDPEVCKRFPDPKNPPCANDIDAAGQCNAVNTSLGFPISVDPTGFVRSILGILLSISGGIAVLLIVYSGYKLMTSNGNPDQIQSAKERLTSAIVGLLFIIFSILILQIISVDILHLPGFKP